MELENPPFDIPKVFGADSPEAKQLAADPDPYKDPETADYVGLAVHCAKGAALCADAEAVKYGETTPSPTAVSDLLPDEPGGYHGYQALFGHKYIAPVLGAGTPSLTRHGYQVTNATRQPRRRERQRDRRCLPDRLPGLPGLLEHQRLPDPRLHGRHAGGRRPGHLRVHRRPPRERATSPACQGLPATTRPTALGSGSPCYVAQAQYYNQAFETFFKRLAADGITPKNTLFVFSSDEGDHEAGANVGRAIQPTPASCDGAIVSGLTVTPDVACTYPAGSFGELDGNLTGLLATEKSDTTPLSHGERHRPGDLRDRRPLGRHAGGAPASSTTSPG